MKKNKRTIILFMLAFISFFLATIEGFIYFGKYEEQILLRIILTIQNSISAFAFSPSVKALDILKEMSEQATHLEWMLLYAYALALFLAQICTATAIFVAFKTVIMRGIASIAGMRYKEYVAIFGYNEKVKTLIENIYKEREKEKKAVILVTNEVLNETEKLELAKKFVIVIEADALALDDREKEKLATKLSKSKQIILFEESEMRNFSIYAMFCETQCFQNLKIKCHLYCEDDGIREVIEEYHSKLIEYRKGVLDLAIFSLAEIKVNEIFNKIHTLQTIPTKIGAKEYILDYAKFDIHLLIVGFGKKGQQMLLQTLNQGVLHSKSRIWIDVVDKDALQKDDFFMKRFHKDYIKKKEYTQKGESADKSFATYTIDGEKCDGELKIRFFEADIRGKNFTDILEEVVKDENGKQEFPLTNIMIGIQELDIIASCIMDVKKHAARRSMQQSIKMFICAELSKNLLEHFNDKKKEESMVEIVATVSNKKAIYLNNILSSDRERIAKQYCYIYNCIYEKLNGSNLTIPTENELKQLTKEVDENWDKQSYQNKMSNYALSCHQIIKKEIINAIWNDAQEKREFCLFGKDGELLEFKEENYKNQQKFVNKLNKEEYLLLKEMICLEHRRWNYFMALHGWGYEEDKVRDKKQKLHECLCSYDKLSDKLPDKVIYDVIPFLIKDFGEDK